MPTSITPYPHEDGGKKAQVSKMFDNISNRYDQLNRVISLGSDQSWRRDLLRRAKALQPQSIIDLATGTGDLAILMAQTGAQVVKGIDISKGMLAVGQEKVKKQALDAQVALLYGDAENIPFEDHSFDVATVAFGIRNFENLDQGLRDILRVLKPGGTLLILETSVPTRFPFKQGYFAYTRLWLPLVGRLFSKDKHAYGYLSESAAHFPYGQALCEILQRNGYIQVQHSPQTFGVATIYQAQKPQR